MRTFLASIALFFVGVVVGAASAAAFSADARARAVAETHRNYIKAGWLCGRSGLSRDQCVKEFRN